MIAPSVHPAAAAIASLLALIAGFDQRPFPIPAPASRPAVFQSADGTPLAGALYEASNRPAPAVVLVHMLSRSKEEWAPYAERLQNAGLTVLALDLRGHGSSGGSPVTLPPMAADVRAAITYLTSRANIRTGSIAVVGASLGANLAALAAADSYSVRAVALLSPSLDYRGVRLDAAVMKKLADRSVWLAASTEDPYSLRTVRELVTGAGSREQYLSPVKAHGTQLLASDADAFSSLLDWLKRALIF